MDIKAGDRVGYISRRYCDETNKWKDFKYKEETISNIYQGKTKTTIKLKMFYNRTELDEITSLETMEDYLRKGIVLTAEPFITNDNVKNHLEKVIEHWNTHDSAKSFLD